MLARRILGAAVAVAAAILLALSLPDIRRYLRLRAM
jgi:hypothetical protein